jgi:hypothetical protein
MMIAAIMLKSGHKLEADVSERDVGMAAAYIDYF